MSCVLDGIIQFSHETPARTALVFGDTLVSYEQLWTAIQRTGSFLKSSGVGYGSRVVVQSVHSDYFAYALFAIWTCNAVFVPVDERASSQTVAEVCKNVDAAFAITDFHVEFKGQSILFEQLRKVVADSNSLTEETFVPEKISDNDVACLMFTTGTTGNPKCVVWNHKSIDANCKTISHDYPLGRDCVEMFFVPLNHAAPIWKMCANCSFGGTAVFLNGMLNLKKAYDYMEPYKVNALYLSPSGISVIQALAPQLLVDFAKSLRVVKIGSSSLTEGQKAFLINSLPDTDIIYTYASSECGSVASINLNEYKGKPPLCVGKARSSVEIKIVDSDFEALDFGQTGRIAVRSPMLCSGYLNSDSDFSEGFFITTDLGYCDSEGFLYVVGRADDVINVGGLKVYPQEIENLVLSLDEIDDCVCFAVNDVLTNQAVCLNAVLKKGSNITALEIQRFLADRLDSYKVPKYIEFTSSIAKTANGKPNRRLQAQLCAEKNKTL